jgi:electron transfer flavoprotein beta subunit
MYFSSPVLEEYMKILACIKAVPEAEDAILFDADAPVLIADETTDLRMNRFDEFAVEEAILIKKKFPGTVIDAISVGPENAQKAVKRALGMGADAGIHIVSNYGASCEADFVATSIAKYAERQSYDLVLTGIMSEDMMQSQVGPMIAQCLNFAWATSVIHEAIGPDQKTVYVERELEGGIREMLDITLPAVLAIQSGINEPRYPSVSNLIRAIDSGMETIPAPDLGVGQKPSAIIGYSYPQKMRDGLILQGTTEEKAIALIKILREKRLL